MNICFLPEGIFDRQIKNLSKKMWKKICILKNFEYTNCVGVKPYTPVAGGDPYELCIGFPFNQKIFQR